MSIAELCTGDFFAVAYLQADTPGFSGDQAAWIDDSREIEGHLQMSGPAASAALETAAQRTPASIFFSADPLLVGGGFHRLTWARRVSDSGTIITISPARYFRVDAVELEGPPGSTELWIVTATEEVARRN